MLRKLPYAVVLLIVLALPAAGELVYGQASHSVYLPVIYNRQLVTPVLKWAYGGCYASWCETGWYSSPAAVDMTGDGIREVVASAYSLWALNGATGQLLWRTPSTANRTWPGIVVADLNRDGQSEIVIGQGGGLVSAYRLDGSLLWQRQPAGTSGELRGLLAADLDGDGSNLEVVVTRAAGSAKNTWVLDAAGNTRPGWPQLPQDDNNPNGYGWGVYNANAAAGDISGDGRLELVVPSDVHYINAYEPDGSPLLANAADYPGKFWGQVGVWENLAVEKRGWGACDGVRAESYRVNFADGPAVLSDLNGDGRREVVVTGNMYNCINGYPSQYTALLLFNPDRSRFNQSGYDWRTIPVDTGAPISQDYNEIESAQSNPAVGDLDGDGQKEIVFASYDGRVHAFWLDKTEHGAWPYAVNQAGEGVLRFASEPLIADLDNDGRAEVIFTSWAQKGSNQYGDLFIVDYLGRTLSKLPLPAPRSSGATWSGGLAAPTLANVDGDPDLELLINTAHAGVVVYDLQHSDGARILWGTGRGSSSRAGSQ